MKVEIRSYPLTKARRRKELEDRGEVKGQLNDSRNRVPSRLAERHLFSSIYCFEFSLSATKTDSSQFQFVELSNHKNSGTQRDLGRQSTLVQYPNQTI